MRTKLSIAAVALIAMGTLPTASSAGPDCVVKSPQPTPQSGSQIQALPDGGVVWVHPSGSQAGAKGSHGYFVVSQNGSSVTVTGYSNDVPLNGRVAANANGRADVCLDAQ